METLISGYIVDIINANKIDQIIKIISEYRIYNIYASGTLKHKSKNAKFISLGNYIDCSIFLSPDISKLSKLKKIEKCKKIKYESYWGNYYYKSLLKLIGNFNDHVTFFLKHIESYRKIADSTHVLAWWLWFLAQTIKTSGHGPIIDKCVDCSTKSPIYSFEIQAGGLKCKMHSFMKNQKQLVNEITQYIWLFSLTWNEYLKKYDKYFLPIQENIIIEFVNYHMGIYL